MPDVLIDGASVALQYFESKESERDVGELIRAIILDRKMPKPKKEPKTVQGTGVRNAAETQEESMID